MSALLSKADMCGAARDVRFGPIADMSRASQRTFSMSSCLIYLNRGWNHYWYAEFLERLGAKGDEKNVAHSIRNWNCGSNFFGGNRADPSCARRTNSYRCRGWFR